jgi:uncharacterized protein (DUF3084 family)
MAIKLTPDRLRRLVLEEKAKMAKSEKKHDLDPKAKKEMYTEMEEESWHKAKGQTVKQTPGKKLQTLKMIKEQEDDLRDRLRRLQERRLALRRQIISELE